MVARRGLSPERGVRWSILFLIGEIFSVGCPLRPEKSEEAVGRIGAVDDDLLLPGSGRSFRANARTARVVHARLRDIYNALAVAGPRDHGMDGSIKGEASAGAASEVENPNVGLGIAQCDGDALAVGGNSFTVVSERIRGFANDVAFAIEPHEVVSGFHGGTLVEQNTIRRSGECGVPRSGVVVDSVDESHGRAG